MGEIVNLRKVRKAKARAEANAAGAENRVRHGRTAAERARDALEAAKAQRTMDGAKQDDR